MGEDLWVDIHDDRSCSGADNTTNGELPASCCVAVLHGTIAGSLNDNVGSDL
jgi:hypothetical protein